MKNVIKKIEGDRFIFMCPACKVWHAINSSWQFDQNFEDPTITPSILVMGNDEKTGKDYRCHSFVTKGMIDFLADCTHAHTGESMKILPVSQFHI